MGLLLLTERDARISCNLDLGSGYWSLLGSGPRLSWKETYDESRHQWTEFASDDLKYRRPAQNIVAPVLFPVHDLSSIHWDFTKSCPLFHNLTWQVQSRGAKSLGFGWRRCCSNTWNCVWPTLPSSHTRVTSSWSDWSIDVIAKAMGWSIF